MAELAVNLETGNIHAVTEIAYTPDLVSSRWRCLSCEIEVFPVAHLGGKYKVAPYFRAAQPHDNCAQDDFGSSGYGQGHVTSGIPDRLVLREANKKVAERAALPKEDNNSFDEALSSRVPTNNVSPQNVVCSLHPLALIHLRKLDLGNRKIQILDWREYVFQYVFKSLNGRLDPNRLEKDRVFYADIMFMKPVETETGITITLYGSSTLDGRLRFQVTFLTAELSVPAKRAVINTTKFWIDKQREFHNEGNGKSIRLYFIGKRDEIQNHVFYISDTRLFCFVEIQT